MKRSTKGAVKALAAGLALGALAGCAPARGESLVLYHQGDWEKDIGYSQSVRAGQHLWISGSVGEAGADMAGQMRGAYENIRATLAREGADFSRIVKETIYTRDIEALVQAKETRKSFYQEHMPAATWVQVDRLFSAGHLLEIEVEALL